jgi:hypothetical protein
MCRRSRYFRWAQRIGGDEEDLSYGGLCTDASGFLYSCGFFNSDTLSIGSSVLIHAPGISADGFLAKFDSTGALNWVRHSNGLIGYDLQIGPGNTIYGGGSLVDTTVFAGTSYPAFINEACIFTYDTAGNELWLQKSIGGEPEIVTGLAVSGTGEALVTGWTYSDTIQFGSSILIDTSIGTHFYVAKLGAPPAGIEELQSQGLLIYPNPALDFVWVFAEEEIETVEVYSILGEKILELAPNDRQTRIPLSAQAFYLLRIKTAKGVITGKVVRNN